MFMAVPLPVRVLPGPRPLTDLGTFLRRQGSTDDLSADNGPFPSDSLEAYTRVFKIRPPNSFKRTPAPKEG